MGNTAVGERRGRSCRALGVTMKYCSDGFQLQQSAEKWDLEAFCCASRAPYLPWWFRALLGHSSQTAADLLRSRSKEGLRQHMWAAARCQHSPECCNLQERPQCPLEHPLPPQQSTHSPSQCLIGAGMIPGSLQRIPSCWDRAGRVNCRAKHCSKGVCVCLCVFVFVGGWVVGVGGCFAALQLRLQCISYGLGEPR